MNSFQTCCIFVTKGASSCTLIHCTTRIIFLKQIVSIMRCDTLQNNIVLDP